MSQSAINGDAAYASYEETRLRWQLRWAQNFIRDIGRWDDYQEMLDAPVLREWMGREVR